MVVSATRDREREREEEREGGRELNCEGMRYGIVIRLDSQQYNTAQRSRYTIQECAPVEKCLLMPAENSSLWEPAGTAGEGKFMFRGDVSGRPEKDARPLELLGSGM